LNVTQDDLEPSAIKIPDTFLSKLNFLQFSFESSLIFGLNAHTVAHI